ncbi:hypothetical protein DRH27_04870 [Candidatus Falkowbacteria bacterium]|nr:MAG: hypothetical protein DRH27_04870 [Candidatus Falkowbacteria bacterium]
MLDKTKKQSGSMLFSVLVSLGILLTMATITIPYLRKFQPNLKLSGAANEMAADLKYAQQLTITEQITHAAYFDDTLDKYYIYRLNPPAATSTLKSVELPPEVSFNNITGLTGNLVRFNSYGSVNESGKIELINTNNKITTINVKPSGFIKIEK